MVSASAASILIVDDHAMMLQVLRSLLGELGFPDVDEARSGEEALKKLQKKAYGLIITDWNMSPMNGLELLKAVRSSNRAANTPVIVMTANGSQDKVFSAREAGATAILVKPFSRPQLGQTIDAAFRQGANGAGDARESANDHYLI